MGILAAEDHVFSVNIPRLKLESIAISRLQALCYCIFSAYNMYYGKCQSMNTGVSEVILLIITSSYHNYVTWY